MVRNCREKITEKVRGIVESVISIDLQIKWIPKYFVFVKNVKKYLRAKREMAKDIIKSTLLFSSCTYTFEELKSVYMKYCMNAGRSIKMQIWYFSKVSTAFDEIVNTERSAFILLAQIPRKFQ